MIAVASGWTARRRVIGDPRAWLDKLTGARIARSWLRSVGTGPHQLTPDSRKAIEERLAAVLARPISAVRSRISLRRRLRRSPGIVDAWRGARGASSSGASADRPHAARTVWHRSCFRGDDGIDEGAGSRRPPPIRGAPNADPESARMLIQGKCVDPPILSAVAAWVQAHGRTRLASP